VKMENRRQVYDESPHLLTAELLFSSHSAPRTRVSLLTNNILELRKQKNWSLEQLSKSSGVPLNAVWRMERGYGSSLTNAFRIAKAFQATVYDVWVIPSGDDRRAKARVENGVSTVRELRLERGWLLRDLSRLSGVSKTTLARIEEGRIPSLRNAAQIAAALGVSIYQIWGYSAT